MQKLLGVLFAVALVCGAAGTGIRRRERAAWEASAKYIETLPGRLQRHPREALKAKLDSGEQVFLLDVREPKELRRRLHRGRFQVSRAQRPKTLDKLPQDKNAQIVVVCASAVRSGYVAQALSFKGYTNVKHLAAGYVAGWGEGWVSRQEVMPSGRTS